MYQKLSRFHAACITFFLFTATAAAAEPTVDDFVDHHRPLLGSWKFTAEVDGQTQSGTGRWELAENKKCFLLTASFEELPALQCLVAYNPVTKKSTQTSVNSDGTYTVATIEMAGLKSGSRVSKGLTAKWKETQYHADGKVVKVTEVLKCLEAGKDRFVFVWADRKEEGKPMPDFKLTYSR